MDCCAGWTSIAKYCQPAPHRQGTLASSTCCRFQGQFLSWQIVHVHPHLFPTLDDSDQDPHLISGALKRSSWKADSNSSRPCCQNPSPQPLAAPLGAWTAWRNLEAQQGSNGNRARPQSLVTQAGAYRNWVDICIDIPENPNHSFYPWVKLCIFTTMVGRLSHLAFRVYTYIYIYT